MTQQISNWVQSPYIVILYYAQFSCGKFLSNILSFNENFVAQIPFTPDSRAYNSVIDPLAQRFDTQLLNKYKIDCVFLTIPPTKQECKNWQQYELGCNAFWGFNALDLNIDQVNGQAIEILNHNKYCFIVAHTHRHWRKCSQMFPNAVTIELVNYETIQQLSMKLKSLSPVENNMLLPIEKSLKFDIGSLFNQEKFFCNVKELLSNFNIHTQELDSRVYEYYNQYVDLYQ